jgi:NAD-dependent deacetylase
MLIAGSSLEVAPASDLPMLARSRQARLIIVNHGHTYMDDHCDVLIHEDVAQALPAIAAACRQCSTPDQPGLV